MGLKLFAGVISEQTGIRSVLIKSDIEDLTELPITNTWADSFSWGEGGLKVLELAHALLRYLYDFEGRSEEAVVQSELICLSELIDYFRDNEEWRMSFDDFRDFYGAMKEYIDEVRNGDVFMAQYKKPFMMEKFANILKESYVKLQEEETSEVERPGKIITPSKL